MVRCILSVIVANIVSSDAFGFVNIKSRFVKPSSARLFLSETDSNVPFFAALDPIESGSKTVTTRLPIGTLFESRDYIFTTVSNVRGYEWKMKEVDDLLDDLTDSSIGFGLESSNPIDYELSQITLVPTEWDQQMYGIGARFDVYDGQQRLVTMCLIFSALREAFANDEGMEGTVKELTNMINPPKMRKDDVLRIEMNKRDNEMLRRILLRDNVPVFTKTQMKALSVTNKRILENFYHISSRISTRSSSDRLKLLDYMIERVFMLVCIPESGSIARNICMAQGKGMNNEPIDDFKGLLCFRYTTEESNEYKTFDKWDHLAAMPDLEAGSVGRDIIANACLLRATVFLRTKIRKSGQLLALEQWLREEITLKNCDGSVFFASNVKPASLLLARFQLAEFQSFNFLSKGNTNPYFGKSITLRLEFIRSLTTTVTSTKELEMVILELLLRAGGLVDNQKLTLEELDKYLLSIERLALWMAIVKPTASDRFRRCFSILDCISRNDLDDSMFLSEEENQSLREGIVTMEFGKTAGGKKIAISLLKRLNSHILLKNDEEIPTTSSFVEHIVPVAVNRKNWGIAWPDDKERKKNVHRLGNLALVSQNTPKKQMKESFSEKKSRFQKEQWPLTQSLSEKDEWNGDAFLANQGELFYLINEIWESFSS